MNTERPHEDRYLPAVLLFSDSAEGAGALRAAVAAIDVRIAANVDIAEAHERLDRQVAMAAVLIDITHDHGDALDLLLDRVDQLADGNDAAVIISAPLDLLDIVSARLGSGAVTLLCDPSPSDRVAALALGLTETSLVLADVASEVDTARLRRLADEVSRIARALSSISSTSPTATSRVSDMPFDYRVESDHGEVDEDAIDAADLRRWIRLRRMREAYFDAALFADPAWDMLLDLMAARLERDRVAVSSLCIAAAVPPTTALRWIKSMTDNGLFERHADPDDGRRIFIRLSDHAAAAMLRYLHAVRSAGGYAL